VCFSRDAANLIQECFTFDGQQLLYMHPSTTKQGKKKKTKAAAQDDQKVLSAPKIIDLLHDLCRRFLKRTNPYSTMLLTDSLSSISPSLGALLLRIFIQLIHGNWFQVTTADLSPSSMNDTSLKHACNWIEALIDANFSGYAMQIISDAAIRESLRTILESIESVDKVSEDLEAVMGSWTHIIRSTGRNPSKLITSSDIHRVQTINF
jgi:hypothetical protein